MIKKGDTLIEVTLAIGIFSMVAIAVVAVMISGTSNVQTTLETTLARAEIDAQAEAIRFVHDSYVSDLEDDETGDASPYKNLWSQIIDKAYTKNDIETNSKILKYSPSTCNEIYSNSNGALTKAFVIDTRALSKLTIANVDKVYISYTSNQDKFVEASTYPRLIYNTSNNTTLLEDNKGEGVKRVEGIYAIAVKGSNTNIVDSTSNASASAYLDFYIRTCWYGTGSETPSTISTVIRLYNPDVLFP